MAASILEWKNPEEVISTELHELKKAATFNQQETEEFFDLIWNSDNREQVYKRFKNVGKYLAEKSKAAPVATVKPDTTKPTV